MEDIETPIQMRQVGSKKIKKKDKKIADGRDKEDVALTTPIPCTEDIETSFNVTDG